MRFLFSPQILGCAKRQSQAKPSHSDFNGLLLLCGASKAAGWCVTCYESVLSFLRRNLSSVLPLLLLRLG